MRPMAPRTSLVSLASPDPHALVEAYLHPLRGRILAAVSERPAVTVQEVARRLDEPPRRVRHHLGVLVDLGLVEMIAEDRRPGGIERRYGSRQIEFDDADGSTVEERIEIAKLVARLLLADIVVAASAGTLARDRDECEVRIYGEVDDPCHDELTRIHRRVYGEVLRAVEDGRKRTQESGEAGIEVVCALFFFEAPLWAGGTADPPARTLGPLDLPVISDLDALVEASDHPVRGRVLVALSERPDVTIQEVARRVGESPRRVRHHVKALLDSGLVQLTGEENRRRVIQRRYGAGPLAVDDAGSVSRGARLKLARATVRWLLDDFCAAEAAGTLGSGSDDFQIRIYGEVDDSCLDELAEIYWRAYREIRQNIEEGRERLRRKGEDGTEVVSALFFFEAPLWRARGVGSV